MASDPALIYIKATAVEKALEVLPKEWAGWRDLDIQNAKLMRMLGKFLETYEKHREMGMKAFRKSYGKDMLELTQQEKKVQKLFNKLMEEFAVRNHHLTRKGFRKEVQQLTVAFDKMVFEAKGKYIKRLSGMVAEEGKKLKS